MSIKWADLAEVFGATLVATVCVVGLFSVGVVALSNQAAVKERGGSGTVLFGGAMICFAACLAIVGYGIFLIVTA